MRQNAPGSAEDNAEDGQRRALETEKDVDGDGDEARGGVAEDGRVVAAVSVAAVAVVAAASAGLELCDGSRDGECGEESQSWDEREAHGEWSEWVGLKRVDNDGGTMVLGNPSERGGRAFIFSLRVGTQNGSGESWSLVMVESWCQKPDRLQG